MLGALEVDARQCIMDPTSCSLQCDVLRPHELRALPCDQFNPKIYQPTSS